MIFRQYLAGYSFYTLLSFLALFALLLIATQQWMGKQRYQTAYFYQYYQALHIAENQHYLLLAGENCQTQQQQNGINFTIRCAAEQVEVSFPLGKLTL